MLCYHNSLPIFRTLDKSHIKCLSDIYTCQEIENETGLYPYVSANLSFAISALSECLASNIGMQFLFHLRVTIFDKN